MSREQEERGGGNGGRKERWEERGRERRGRWGKKDGGDWEKRREKEKRSRVYLVLLEKLLSCHSAD